LKVLSLIIVGLVLQDSVFESKVAKLVELGFERQAVIQALQLFNGNEEQAAGFLFG
jgi:DNA damage-inducible protein 1